MKVVMFIEGADILNTIINFKEEHFFERLEVLFLGKLKERNCIPETVQNVEISISVMEPERIRAINAQYREIDRPTDVLSFPMWEVDSVFMPPENWANLPLGDILICPNEIEVNAKDNNKDFEKELVLVLSHGLLHLIGFDHDCEERQRDMWSNQDLMVNTFFMKGGAEIV